MKVMCETNVHSRNESRPKVIKLCIQETVIMCKINLHSGNESTPKGIKLPQNNKTVPNSHEYEALMKLITLCY